MHIEYYCILAFNYDFSSCVTYCFISINFLLLETDECRVSEEMQALLTKLRALYEHGQDSNSAKQCCRSRDKIKQPHVHGELSGMPVIITLTEVCYNNMYFPFPQ